MTSEEKLLVKIAVPPKETKLSAKERKKNSLDCNKNKLDQLTKRARIKSSDP